MRKRVNQLVALSLSVIMAGAMLAGCGSEEKGGTSDASSEISKTGDSGKNVKDTITLAITEIPTVNPYGASNKWISIVDNLIHAKLIKIDADTQEILPDLATEWSPNEDNTVWTFTLREGVKFHDGTEFTADDVKFTWDYGSVPSESVGNPWTADVTEVNVVDDYTVEFVCEGPVADLPSYLCYPILSKEAFETMDNEETAAAIGAGPYVLTDNNAGISYSYEKFEDYFGEPAVTPNIECKVINDENSMEMALRSGEIDVMSIESSEVAKQIMEDEDYVCFSKLTADTMYLGINMDRVTDVNIRKAIAMAINREEIAETFGDDITATAVYTLFAPSSEGYVETDIPEYDPEGAKALLEEAGYGEGLKLVFCHIDGHSVAAEVIQAQLGEIGIEVELTARSGSGYSQTLKDEGNYDLYMNTTTDFGGVLGYWNKQLMPGVFLNCMNYENPEMTALHDRAQKADYDEMLECWGEMQKIFVEDCPAVAVMGLTNLFAGVKGLDGIVMGSSSLQTDLSHAYIIEG